MLKYAKKGPGEYGIGGIHVHCQGSVTPLVFNSFGKSFTQEVVIQQVHNYYWDSTTRSMKIECKLFSKTSFYTSTRLVLLTLNRRYKIMVSYCR